MTTTSILPSSGPPPPGLDRPVIPARFRPPAADAAVKSLQAESQRTYQPQPVAPQGGEAQASTGVSSGAGRTLGGTAAVAVQVQESAAKPKPTPSPSRASAPLNDSQLSDDDKAEVSRLKARDREVRAHEAAHQSAGQGYTQSASYDYVRGPDDRRYAVGGHVKIDTSAVPDDPHATIAKMEVVRRAALAPAQPSGQDRAVASAAAAKIRDAEAQLASETKDTADAGDEKAQGTPQPLNLIA